jgi:hypothetical protein
MDTTAHFTLVVSREEQAVSPRLVAAQAVEQFERLDSPWISRSEIARKLQVPDSTLRHWIRRRRQRLRDSQWPPCSGSSWKARKAWPCCAAAGRLLI